jgi:hypothetical protein
VTRFDAGWSFGLGRDMSTTAILQNPWRNLCTDFREGRIFLVSPTHYPYVFFQSDDVHRVETPLVRFE